jgi:SAM-dependent methyltransferase
VSSDFPRQLWQSFTAWWREQIRARGAWGASRVLLRELWEFFRDSLPERRRARYGDMEYDWEHRVNTTAGTVGWRERLLGVFHSAYQPTEPAAFREMMAALPVDFSEFTFVDLGSGKGRTLLMAAQYPFRRIVGVELIKTLHYAAKENIAAYRAKVGTGPREHRVLREAQIEAVLMDGTNFVFPETPLVVYLFNPLPEAGLRRVMRKLIDSCNRNPRAIWVVYHNPLLTSVLEEFSAVAKVGSGNGYDVFRLASSESA